MIHPPDPHENDWIMGLIHKHPAEAVIILGELLNAGLANQTCSVRDVSFIPTERGLTGAVMKVLKHLGFEHTDEKVPDFRLGKRGKVSVWKLVDRHKAETYLEAQLQYFQVLLASPL